MLIASLGPVPTWSVHLDVSHRCASVTQLSCFASRLGDQAGDKPLMDGLPRQGDCAVGFPDGVGVSWIRDIRTPQQHLDTTKLGS